MKHKDFIKNLRGMGEVELVKEVKDKKEKLWQMMQDLKLAKLKNTSELSLIKSQIAGILTVIKEKQHGTN